MFYKLVNRASGKVLDAHSDDVNQNGCRIQLWTDTGGRQQLWRIE
ncbi:RICIN domain-containing protein [Singulisphaera sp. Ch08]|uniref:RICIN domain-containing protein n=1 Tax=Singulisphaera sp. Ch08 TaxID=3120278 RepID=A0AAU7C9R7_9BACT